MSTRGTIEAFIRDKVGTTSIVLFLIYDAMTDVSTLHLLMRLFALVGLAGYTLYENHRHAERIGNTQKSTDLIREFKDHINKEFSRFNGTVPVMEKSPEGTAFTEPFINAISERFMNWVAAGSPTIKPEPKVEEEPVQEESEESTDG